MEPSTQKNDLEVMGVSRSGRVRKKSSKLMDFQSPDDIETRHKKNAAAKQRHANSNATTASESVHQQQANQTMATNNTTDAKSDDEQLSSIEDFIAGDNESFDSDIDIDDIGTIIDEATAIGSSVGGDDDNENELDSTVRRSIYMTEKVNKKKILKDGKVVHGKTQRKDKGKTRFTAYMLWAKDVRKQMLAQQPDLDFATVSRRLGEMWANVPAAEKVILKRRAKRLATRILKNQSELQQYSTSNKETMNIRSPTKFLNKGAITVSSNKTRKTFQSDGNHNNNGQQQQQQQQQKQLNVDCTTINLTQSTKTSPIITTPGIYKVTGIEPLDVAAHLKMLGDSLTIIGERLKEHEGQITVSGSLSVLLDSLLCSLGPLMCLTAQIRGLNDNNSRLKESLRNTLDNIAYVMPGL